MKQLLSSAGRPEGSFQSGMNSGSPWETLRRVDLDPKHLAAKRIVTLDRADTAHFTFDILRTKVLKTLRQNNWSSVVITSPTPGCGKTVVSLNLAFSLSHLPDCHTVLLDLDLRRPQVAKTLGLSTVRSVEHFLRGQATIEETFVLGTSNVAFAPNSQAVSDAAELLQDPMTSAMMTDLKNKMKPTVLLCDMPPMLGNDDVLAFLPNVDCVILVAAAESSTFNEVDLCESTLSQYTNVLGVVLNKCQFEPEKYGY